MQNVRYKIFLIKSPWLKPWTRVQPNANRFTRILCRQIHGHSAGTSDLILEGSASQLQSIWHELFNASPKEALNHRNAFYQAIRKHDLLASSQWSFTILELISPDKARFADWQFALELLISQREWSLVVKLLTDVAKQSPASWEQLVLFLVSATDSNLPAITCMDALASSCVHMGVDLATISRPSHIPIMQFIQMFLVKYDVNEILGALNELSSTNTLQAASLASGILRVVTDGLIDTVYPPTVLEKSDEKPVAVNSIAPRIWEWKFQRETTTVSDLKVYMMFLIYKRMPKQALDLYHRCSDLQSIDLNEALLLAAASVGDYERLQSEFERVEKDPQLIQRLGSGRYAIILKALGFIGDKGILDTIFDQMSERHSQFKTRAVFHALLYSHALRGDTKRVLKTYNVMIKSQIEPNRSTFSLILKAFKDSRDFNGMMSLIGQEMLTKYQFSLENSELSVLLAVCGKRRDYKSCLVVWKWGQSLLKPDRLSYNAYLHCIVSCNQFEHAWMILREMEDRQMVGIDTLSIMLNGAGRSPDPTDFLEEILKKQRSLDIEVDDGWYMSLLSVLNELGSLSRFEQAFNEMKKTGIRPHASHYALYTELLSKTKNFAKHEKLSLEMKQRRVPLNYAFIAKHLALLTTSGSSSESRKIAENAAHQLLKDGYFDPRSSTVPRGAIPVRVIEPVVCRLIKSRQYVSAKRLLDSLRKQWMTFNNKSDEYMLWALYMKLADRSENLSVIDLLWSEFIRTLRLSFVLCEPATFDKPPTFKLSPRYRKNFGPQIIIRINQLTKYKNSKGLLQLPYELNDMGLAMDSDVVNAYIIGLIDVGEYNEGFKIATKASLRPPDIKKGLSRKAMAVLFKASSHVNLDEYGSLGNYIKTHKEDLLDVN